MQGSRIRLTGIGEGLESTLQTTLGGGDSPLLVLQALNTIFPELNRSTLDPEPIFGKAIKTQWEFEKVSLESFLQLLHEQRILDTALDAMSRGLNGERTMFHLSRQAAMAGKIAFPIPGEQPLGGVFEIHLSGNGLIEWLEAATWHSGRTQVPRSIDDERAMQDDGEASTWH